MSKPIPPHIYSLYNSTVLFSSGFPATSKVAAVLCAIKLSSLLVRWAGKNKYCFKHTALQPLG